MTVAISTSKVVYTGNGSTTQWDIPFPFLSASDLQVYRIGTDGSVLHLTSGYEVNTNSNVLTYPLPNTGALPLASGAKLLIMRRTPLTQQTQLTAQQTLDASVLEDGYDKAMMISQELSEQLGRCVQFPIGFDGTNTDIENYVSQVQTAIESSSAVLEQAAALKEDLDEVDAASLQAIASLAEDWASKTGATVDGTEYSAKKYAQDASSAASTAAAAAEQAVQAASTSTTGKAETSLSNLTDAGKIVASGLAMPSTTYETLTLGATGATYTMPSNGYVRLEMASTSASQFIQLARSGVAFCTIHSSAANQGWSMFMPVKKGEEIAVNYNFGGAGSLIFHYAAGSTSEAN